MSRNVKKKRIVKLEPQTVELFAEVLSKLRPPPPLTVSQWADKYRVLSAESSAEPGRWHTEKAPYQRAIMDAIGDPHVRSVVVMSAAQIGKTDAFILNPLGYYMDYAPCPVMCMQPTLDMGQTLSKDRIAPMIRDTPRLTGLVDTKSRYAGNTVMKKNFPGGHITIVGANSPSSLASRPIKVLLADEIDRYPKSAGTEGDPLDLAKKRQTTFWDYKTVMVSTPTIKGDSRIEDAYLLSTQEEWNVPCPECGAYSGKGKVKTTCALFTMTERKTRNEIIIGVPNRKAETIVKAVDALERKLGARKFRLIFKSITFDNGTEFAAADMLERSCINKTIPRTKVYFCHPYSSWERGSNEHVNGMIRRKHPKGTDFSKVSKEQLAETEKWINEYPRKIFGYKSSAIMFQQCLNELGIAM